MTLKVLIMGGLGCGKTSALASIFDQVINGPVKNYFTFTDRTESAIKESNNGLERQDVLCEKQLELKSILETPADDFFIVDRNPTYHEWTFTLRLTLPGTKKSMDIEFMDVPGNWFETNLVFRHPHVEDILKHIVHDTDVFIVMVDTPYLMHEKELIAKATNSIAGIHDYLTQISDDEEKLVIFSPVKCEKWVKEGTMDQVVEKLKKMYASTIKMLKAFPKMNICIIPIETAGNLLFFEYSEPLLMGAGVNSRRCKKINDSMVRFGNGEIYFLKGNETFYKDPHASISENIMRPYCWYQINPYPSSQQLYAPNNCEQIPLHLVEFMLKTMIRKRPGGIAGRIRYEVFGGISKETLQSQLREIQSKGIIKENVNHIEYLKRCK